jgi:hypothetical protein
LPLFIIFTAVIENIQTKTNDYHARSFEDAFISINISFIESNKDSFKSLKNIKKIKETPLNFYDIADNCIDKKPLFATAILVKVIQAIVDRGFRLYIKSITSINE